MNDVLFNIGFLNLKDADVAIKANALSPDVDSMFGKSSNLIYEKLKLLPDDEADQLLNNLNTKYPNAFSTITPSLKSRRQLQQFYEKQVYELYEDYDKSPTEQTAKSNPVLFRSYLNEKFDTTQLRTYLQSSSYDALKATPDFF